MNPALVYNLLKKAQKEPLPFYEAMLKHKERIQNHIGERDITFIPILIKELPQNRVALYSSFTSVHGTEMAIQTIALKEE